MKTILLVSLVLLCIAALISACVPPDCDNVDCGTCGNACCKILFKTQLKYEDLIEKIVNGTSKGGPDGRYIFDSANPDYSAPGSLLIQVSHDTLSLKYRDDLSLLVFNPGWVPLALPSPAFCPPKPEGACIVGFSKSRVGLCDYGQNFKNLVGLMKGLEGVYYKHSVMLGCPSPVGTFP